MQSNAIKSFTLILKLTVILATANSETGGRKTWVNVSSRDGWIFSIDLHSNDNTWIKVSISFGFGVSPALITLSEHAIHSMQSENYMKG